MWIVWLPLLAPAVVNLIQTQPGATRLSVALAGLAVFVAIYLFATWRSSHELLEWAPRSGSGRAAQWLTIGVCMLLSVVLGVLGRGQDWLDPFILTSAYVGSSLPTRVAVPTIGMLLLLILAVAWLAGLSLADFGTALVFVGIVGATTISMVRSVRTGQELRAAREELTHLAVMNERLRIARDLHDLLGHNLSLIALKSELAGRLVAAAPAQAAGEMSEVADVARTTLQEVREAVGAYRQPSLSSELHAAGEILSAAGIAWRAEVDESMLGRLPAAVESVLAATIREGITNVIRHSRARQATARVTRNLQHVSAEVIDDGVGMPLMPAAQTAAATNASGAGLRGLAERVAALRGEFEAGPHAGGGFRLAVSLPLAQAGPKGVTSWTVPGVESPAAPSGLDDAPADPERGVQR